MPGFASMDDLITEMTTNGKFRRTDWNKLTHAVGTQAAGIWYALFHSTGNPAAGVLGATGTNLAWHPCTDRSTGAILHGGDVSTDTKHILNASAFSAAATSMPAIFMLVDLLGWYPVTTVTTTGDQALINSVTFTANAGTDLLTYAGWDIQSYTAVQFTSTTTLPAGLSTSTTYYLRRASSTTATVHTSLANVDSNTPVDITDTGTGTHTLTMTLGRYEDGKGVQCFVTPSVVLGAGTPNIQITYVDTGDASSVTPTTLPISNASAPVGQIEYSGTAAGKFGPFVPLAAGDQGMKRATQFNYSATHTSGTTNLVLCRPLLTLPMTTIGVACERDLLNQVPSLPRVYDGACLAWLMYAGAATPVSSGFYGHLDFVWG